MNTSLANSSQVLLSACVDLEPVASNSTVFDILVAPVDAGGPGKNLC